MKIKVRFGVRGHMNYWVLMNVRVMLKVILNHCEDQNGGQCQTQDEKSRVWQICIVMLRRRVRVNFRIRFRFRIRVRYQPEPG